MNGTYINEPNEVALHNMGYDTALRDLSNAVCNGSIKSIDDLKNWIMERCGGN